jgi:hypothetical protein
MINILLDTPEVSKFFETDLHSIIQKEKYGEKNFQDAYNHLKPIYELLMEELELLNQNSLISTHLHNKVLSYISKFNSIVDLILNYNQYNDFGSSDTKDNLINNCIRWHNEIFDISRSKDELNKNEYFLVHYLAIKNLSLKNNDKEFQDLRDELKNNVLESIALLDGVKEKVKENIVTEYAEIFQKQADKHSSFNISFSKDKKFKFGAAQTWMLVSLTFIVIIISALLTFKKNFPLSKKVITSTTLDLKTNKKVDLFEEVLDYEHLATRVLIISICLFILVISVRQFTINKHLSILNKHRQNSLQSYKLFELSMSKDSSSKDALLLEVAKAIYDTGSTGYLVGKDTSPTSSIIELTRIMNGNKVN